eukprot:6212848-Pleurochrysis_carterae.AAC.4
MLPAKKEAEKLKDELKGVKVKVIKLEASKEPEAKKVEYAQTRVDNLRDSLKIASNSATKIEIELKAKAAAMAKKIKVLKDQLATAQAARAAADARASAAEDSRNSALTKLAEAEEDAMAARQEVVSGRAELDKALATVKELKRKKPERKAGHSGRQQLEAKWGSMTQNARRVALMRHTHDIATHHPRVRRRRLGAVCFRDGALLETRPFIKARMQFGREFAEVLRMEWGVELAFYLKTELALSDRNFQKARLALSDTYARTPAATGSAAPGTPSL